MDVGRQSSDFSALPVNDLAEVRSLRSDAFDMADTFQLEIVTPEKKVVDTPAEEAQIPGKNGDLGILPGHAPLITELAVGEIKFR